MLKFVGLRMWRSNTFRYKLRHLFWAVALISLLAAYVGYKLQSYHKQKTIASNFVSEGGVYGTFGFLGFPNPSFGDLISLQPYGTISEEEWAELATLNNLEMLFLQDSNADDRVLSHVKQLPRLKWLVLSGLPITDDGLRQLSESSTIEYLYLDGTMITDDSIAVLASLRHLQHLNIEGCDISGIGQERLEEMLPDAEIVVQ